jgi:hypothetical protein
MRSSDTGRYAIATGINAGCGPDGSEGKHMQGGWVEVTDPAILASVLGLRIPLSDSVYSVVTRLPDEDRDSWWSARLDIPRSSSRGSLGLQIMKTKYFFNLAEAKKVRRDLFIMAVAYAQTSSLPAAGAAGVLTSLATNLKVLADDEAELVGVIMGSAGSADPFTVGVLEATVKRAYAGATVNIDPLLDSLERKKIIEKIRVGKIRLLR